jgi:hypothetical protein
MKRRTASIALAMLVVVGVPRLAHGQYCPAAVLHHPTPTAFALDGDTKRVQRASSDGGVAHDALVGAGLGAGLGLAAGTVVGLVRQ